MAYEKCLVRITFGSHLVQASVDTEEEAERLGMALVGSGHTVEVVKGNVLNGYKPCCILVDKRGKRHFKLGADGNPIPCHRCHMTAD